MLLIIIITIIIIRRKAIIIMIMTKALLFDYTISKGIFPLKALNMTEPAPFGPRPTIRQRDLYYP